MTKLLSYFLLCVEKPVYKMLFDDTLGIMGVRQLLKGEKTWLEQIRCNFMFPQEALLCESLSSRPGALILSLRPCKVVTPAGKEVMILSNEELVASSCHGLTPPHHVSLASDLCRLGMGLEVAPKVVDITLRKKSVKATSGSQKRKPKDVFISNTSSKRGNLRVRKATLDNWVIVSDTLAFLDGAGGDRSERTKSGAGAGSGSTEGAPASATRMSATLDMEQSPSEDLKRRLASKRKQPEGPDDQPAVMKKVAFEPVLIIVKKTNMKEVIAKLSSGTFVS
ncbi:hypothetical protein Hdeb2414_s0009g00308181 [Helianthus debilis subsp. tardiflorus]